MSLVPALSLRFCFHTRHRMRGRGQGWRQDHAPKNASPQPRFPGTKNSDIDHAIIAGNRIALIDSKLWSSGHYALDKVGQILENGTMNKRHSSPSRHGSRPDDDKPSQRLGGRLDRGSSLGPSGNHRRNSRPELSNPAGHRRCHAQRNWGLVGRCRGYRQPSRREGHARSKEFVTIS